MKDYGLIYSTVRPQAIEITNSLVFIATDIEEYQKTVDGRLEHGYQYNYVSYDKDEYIKKLDADNKELKEQVLETQEALVELYEMLEG